VEGCYCWCHCGVVDDSIEVRSRSEKERKSVIVVGGREGRMSVEDLGTRELGQVRSQRLDEVSFGLFFLLSFHRFYCFCSCISYS
jgi:hypothetical protein